MHACNYIETRVQGEEPARRLLWMRFRTVRRRGFFLPALLHACNKKNEEKVEDEEEQKLSAGVPGGRMERRFGVAQTGARRALRRTGEKIFSEKSRRAPPGC